MTLILKADNVQYIAEYLEEDSGAQAERSARLAKLLREALKRQKQDKSIS